MDFITWGTPLKNITLHNHFLYSNWSEISLNIKSFLNTNLKIFLQINEECNLKSFDKIYKNIFSNNKYELNLINNRDQNQVYENAFNIVQYGWKKEAVPIIHQKKSLIGRFFDLFFN